MILTRALAVLLLALAVQTTPEQGFTSLFNGKDFTDWKVGGPAETFTVQDGAIVARGTPQHDLLRRSVSEITRSATSS